MIRSKKIAGMLLFGALMAGTSLTAQTTPEPQQQQQQEEISDEQLNKFAKAFMTVQTISQNARPQVAELVQKEGMDVQRFSEIHEASTNPEIEVEATEAEKAQYAKITAGIEELQVTVQKDMETAIAAQGLTIDEYESIIMGLQTDPALQQRLQAKLQQ